MSRMEQPAPVPLESGDRLAREEFHRRYTLRPDIHKAELIDGVVYVTRRVRFAHGETHGVLMGCLGVYSAYHPDVHVYGPVTIFLDDRNEVQPDVSLAREQSLASRLWETEDGFFAGVPDLIGEVAESDAAYDLHDKLESYRRAGVPEYIVWSIFENDIRWLILRDGQYVPLEPDEHGIIESAHFPGLRLNVPAMLSGNRAAVLAAVLNR